ncbi:SPASM domain peptide maturase, grasp-with-spasm system [Chryseobacterium ureilyticum]|uniref:SPASM domain peptide maturase, grasp-with-spasm system n=1 Tax=Chryseobacterium ureilyticum TaxID=373668 RepID=A0A1N7QI80_9FLAO|nr:hypothetical protein [Chryseobacterium ureilyticum]SIT22217.1 SPASM domain peptide maturase, grasp-with-spasm system [Chryseobacterium ureilyticum]
MELTYLQNNKDKYIHVFSCCIPVKGEERGAIYDLQREEIEFVPNTMIDFLEYIDQKKISSVLHEFEADKMAGKYLDYLAKNEIIFYSHKEFFPKLAVKSINEDTCTIQFVTLILSDFIRDHFNTVIENISALGVKRLHIHIDRKDCMKEINTILDALDYTRVTNISFSIPYQKIDKKLYTNNRLKTLYIFNSPKEKALVNNEVTSLFITVSDARMFLPKFNINTVEINTTAYNIARNYNLSLYKTIFVDESGKIKFNITDTNNYGNITDSFEKIKTGTIQKLSELWNIKKEDIAPCNACEFRFCCTVVQVPFKSNNGYAVACNYDPYNAELN